MVPHIRNQFNQAFTAEKYDAILADVHSTYNHIPAFRIAESPVFVGQDLKKQLFEACEEITDVICQPNFKEFSQNALLAGQVVPNETAHTTFLQMDFGICKDENGGYIPQLIEVQGFPSLYFYQHLIAELYRKHYHIPENYTHLFGDITAEEYVELLRSIIVGDCEPKKVVLLEVEPQKQTTQIDFWGTRRHLGVAVKCVSDLIVEGRDVFYMDDDGNKIHVERIYNRVIFDELLRRDDIKRQFYFTKEANVDWIGHPHWFFRISKHTLPLLKSKYVPDSYFLNQIDAPEDIHNYVLKPLYSFSGTGVIINLNQYDIDGIEDKENYILQRKVQYAPVVETQDIPSKCEIRMLMLWERGAPRPRMVNNLARLTKGEMVGVKYNKNKTWVGGSVAFFEK